MEDTSKMGCTSLPAFSFACLILIALTSASDFGYSPEDLLIEDRTVSLYESWLAKHNKAYTLADEKQQRYEIFRDNLRYIDKVNHRNLSFRLGLNKFSDLSDDEFRSRYLRNISTEPRGHAKKLRYEDVIDVPESIDWRTKGAVTAVRDQGECGSCWAFTVAGAVESANQIATGNLVSLSVQELIDCDKPQNNGCDGGTLEAGFQFIFNNGGIDTEADYPYQGRDGQCDAQKLSQKVVSINGYGSMPGVTVNDVLEAVANQPVAALIDASSRHFRHYHSGVLSGKCGKNINHGLLLVGYGSEWESPDYIIGKNSWGTQWGEDGYIRLDRTVGGNGQCGIYKDVVFPAIVSN